MTGEIYSDKDAVYVSMPEMYGKTIKMNYKDINKLISDGQGTDSIDYEKYSSVFDLKSSKKFNAISKDYTDFLRLSVDKLYTKAGKAAVIVKECNDNKTYD